MKKIIDTLSSVRLFFVLAALLLAAFALGGLIPQGQTPGEYREMFGSSGSRWVRGLGLHDVFSSLWFLAVMAVAALNILACTVRQWKQLRLRPGLFLCHFAVILVFLGGLVRGIFSVRGSLAMETSEIRGEFMDAEGRNVPLPFDVQLRDFQIRRWGDERHIIHAVRGKDVLESVEAVEGREAAFTSGIEITVSRFYPNFVIGDKGPESLDEARENPALAVIFKNEKKAKPQYLFARYPDFHGSADASGVRLVYEYLPGRVKQFESRIAFLERSGQEAPVPGKAGLCPPQGSGPGVERVISVNSPADHLGYRFYQSGYDEKKPGFSVIQVSKDPSVFIIYAGFALLMTGLTWAFWRQIAGGGI